MESVGYAGLKANLEYAEKRLAAHKADEVDLIMAVEKVKEQLREVVPNDRRDLFQSVFDEENFTDAIWFLQDEPEIKMEARNFTFYKMILEDKLIDMGVKIQ